MDDGYPDISNNAEVTAADPRDRDPGWFSSRSLLWAFVPVVGLRRAQQETENPLQQLRLVFTAFGVAMVLIGVVVLALSAGDATQQSVSPDAVAAGVSLYGLLSLFLPAVIVRPLDCSSRDALANSYRTRFFLLLAFAESAALMGFVGFFLTYEWWLYPVGGFFAAIGFARLAPTRPHLHREQEALVARGCGISLTDALTSS